MENNQALRPGATLRHGSYEIVRKLGQGGFGITYLARDVTLDRLVAIKEFFPSDYCGRDADTSHITLGTASNTEFIGRLKEKFIKEARNIANLNHPGIIKIHAAFEENNTAYYVMDYMDGSNLDEWVEAHGPMAPADALRVISGVGDALTFIHGRSINHLDVKPSNIMLGGSEMRPVLIDFGLSKRYDDRGRQTSTTPVGLSHGFAPMEQYNHGGVSEFSPQTDLYSLAATLYYALTGVTPPQATVLVEEELTFPDGFPRRLIAPIVTAMETVRKRRQPSVAQFLAEINPKSAEPAPAPAPTPKPRPTVKVTPVAEPKKTVISTEPGSVGKSRRPLVIAAVAGVLILIGIVVGGKLLSGESANVEPQPTEEPVAGVPASGEVTDMKWESPLGPALYTGHVDDAGTPNGEGLARIVEGKYKDCTYKGMVNHGVFEGKAFYTAANGDTFDGTYVNNQYFEGRYTNKKSGAYYIGNFKDGSPADGQWYNNDGTPVR